MLDDIFLSETVLGKRGRPAELYPDVSSKDAAVPPDLPVPNCDCERPACVSQSRHPDTAARCFYECGTSNVRTCFGDVVFSFFNWLTDIFIFLIFRSMRGVFSSNGLTVLISLTQSTSFLRIRGEAGMHVSTSSGGFHLPQTLLQ